MKTSASVELIQKHPLVVLTYIYIVLSVLNISTDVKAMEKIEINFTD